MIEKNKQIKFEKLEQINELPLCRRVSLIYQQPARELLNYSVSARELIELRGYMDVWDKNYDDVAAENWAYTLVLHYPKLGAVSIQFSVSLAHVIDWLNNNHPDGDGKIIIKYVPAGSEVEGKMNAFDVTKFNCIYDTVISATYKNNNDPEVSVLSFEESLDIESKYYDDEILDIVIPNKEDYQHTS